MKSTINGKELWVVYREGLFRETPGYEVVSVHLAESEAKIALAEEYMSDIMSFIGEKVYEKLYIEKFVPNSA